MKRQNPLLWLGRIRHPQTQKVCVVRIQTELTEPGPEDRIEEIADPWGPSAQDVWTFVRDATPLPQGLQGLCKDFALLPPLIPSKIIGVGRNFRAHAAELGNPVPQEPLLFLKPPSCLIPSGQAICLPAGFERIDMEGELVVVMGRQARHVRVQEAWNYIAGYALGNDVSCRDLQKRDNQWIRAKGFDSFGPLSTFIRLTEPGFRLPTEHIQLRSYLDQKSVQEAFLSSMIFSIPELIAYISAFMTLEPGDLIYTGTPEGVHPLTPGQTVRVETNGFALSTLRSPVARA